MDDLVEIYCILLDGTFNSTSTLILDTINNEKIEAQARACLVRGLGHQTYHFIHSKDSFMVQHSETLQNIMTMIQSLQKHSNYTKLRKAPNI